MIELYVSGQRLTITTPVVAADSLQYLTAQVYFTDSDWDGAVKWLHFRSSDVSGANVYDLQLDGSDGITEGRKLNLTAGEWSVYLTGVRGETRLTTIPVILTVKPSGLSDAPLHEVPLSALEQVSYRAELAIELYRELRHSAGLHVSGFFSNYAALAAGVPNPYEGEAYAVGSAAPYSVYVWDGIGGAWVNAGQLVSVRAEGRQGTTFIPSVDEAGNISWVNDDGRENPAAVNIMGPQGATGAQGPAGKSAYDAATDPELDEPYTGDEAAFNQALAAMPEHKARHLPGGADPITVKEGNLENAAVTAAKIASGAVSAVYTVAVGTEWSGDAAPYTQTIAVTGLSASDKVIADIVLDDYSAAEAQQDAYSRVYRITAADGSITLYAGEKAESGFRLQILAVKK